MSDTEEHYETDRKEEDVKKEEMHAAPDSPIKTKPSVTDEHDEEVELLQNTHDEETIDEKNSAEMELIRTTEPTTPLEMAFSETLKRKEQHILRLTNEITKLKSFISKRKQTYKRKRKEEGAPTRALSAYNIFIQAKFAELAKENEKALKSTDTDAQLKRVPPANLVAATGNKWKDLPAEEKAKYEEIAKADRERYEKEMAQYQPPDKHSNRKRNKTGYNMFFSAHVLRLKQSESGVPSERGSVARLVGTAWKALSAEEKQYYEREADKHNGMNPVKDDVDDEDDEDKRHMHMHPMDPYAHMHPMDMHGMPPPMHQPHYDPRYYAPHPSQVYGQPPPAYDYGQHPQHHSRGGRGTHGGYGQYPPPQRHPYDAGMM